jgi:hypothetical protein
LTQSQFLVSPGLDPGVHVFVCDDWKEDVDARIKSGQGDWFYFSRSGSSPRNRSARNGVITAASDPFGPA